MTKRRKKDNQKLLHEEYVTQKFKTGKPANQKTCIFCHIEKALTEFYYSRSQVRVFIGRACKQCVTERAKLYHAAHPIQRIEERHRSDSKRSLSRKDPLFRAYFIVKDSKRSDARMGLSFDQTLTEEVVEALISRGCFYCGNKAMMTLDRIDNGIGHKLNNVNPSCLSCNMLRTNMPYDAWMHLVPSIKEARDKGLFGAWRRVGIRAAA